MEISTHESLSALSKGADTAVAFYGLTQMCPEQKHGLRRFGVIRRLRVGEAVSKLAAVETMRLSASRTRISDEDSARFVYRGKGGIATAYCTAWPFRNDGTAPTFFSQEDTLWNG